MEALSCKSILVIDDDATIRQTIKDILEIRGYRVVTAGNGIEGIRALESLSPEPCMILLDLMPSKNGWQFLDVQKLDHRWKHIPVVICSAYEASARAVHPAGFILKPIQLNEIVGVVKAFCK